MVDGTPTILSRGLQPTTNHEGEGALGDEEIGVIIDSGASHNFVSKKLISNLGFEVDERASYGVGVFGLWV